MLLSWNKSTWTVGMIAQVRHWRACPPLRRKEENGIWYGISLVKCYRWMGKAFPPKWGFDFANMLTSTRNDWAIIWCRGDYHFICHLRSWAVFLVSYFPKLEFSVHGWVLWAMVSSGQGGAPTSPIIHDYRTPHIHLHTALITVLMFSYFVGVCLYGFT